MFCMAPVIAAGHSWDFLTVRHFPSPACQGSECVLVRGPLTGATVATGQPWLRRRLVSQLAPFAGMQHLDVAGGTGDIAFRVLEKIREAEAHARGPAAAEPVRC